MINSLWHIFSKVNLHIFSSVCLLKPSLLPSKEEKLCFGNLRLGVLAVLIQEMDELEHCLSLRGYINSLEEDTCKTRKKLIWKDGEKRWQRRNDQCLIILKGFGEF